MDIILLVFPLVAISVSICLGFSKISDSLEKISGSIGKMNKESASKPICENCKWYDDFSGVCCNDKSSYVTDYKDDDEDCEVYEEVQTCKD